MQIRVNIVTSGWTPIRTPISLFFSSYLQVQMYNAKTKLGNCWFAHTHPYRTKMWEFRDRRIRSTERERGQQL